MKELVDKIRFDTEAATDFFAKRLAFTLGPVELKNMIEKNKVKVIDVRRTEDYFELHIPTAISIPKDEIKNSLQKFDSKDIHVVYCYNQQCHLASAAALEIAHKGYPVMELEGGFKVWEKDFGFEVESG